MDIFLILWVTGAVAFIAFCLVIIIGAPFLPTKPVYVEKALDMLNLQPGDTLLDLGSGDGRMLVAAAKRQIYSVGYEVNLFLYLYSLLTTLKYRNYTHIVLGNFWNKQLPEANGVFVFLLQPFMKRLNIKVINNYKKPPKLVSFVFTIPGKKPTKVSDSLYLYTYE